MNLKPNTEPNVEPHPNLMEKFKPESNLILAEPEPEPCDFYRKNTHLEKGVAN